MVDLARVLDTDALASHGGTSGRVILRVPARWLTDGDTIELVVPTRLVCALCEGGGCDRCERRGGLRVDGDKAMRRLRVVLPKRVAPGAFVMRVVRPLGDAMAPEHLLLQISVGDIPSEGCTRIDPSAANGGRVPRGMLVVFVLVILAGLAAVVTASR